MIIFFALPLLLFIHKITRVLPLTNTFSHIFLFDIKNSQTKILCNLYFFVYLKVFLKQILCERLNKLKSSCWNGGHNQFREFKEFRGNFDGFRSWSKEKKFFFMMQNFSIAGWGRPLMMVLWDPQRNCGNFGTSFLNSSSPFLLP